MQRVAENSRGLKAFRGEQSLISYGFSFFLIIILSSTLVLWQRIAQLRPEQNLYDMYRPANGIHNKPLEQWPQEWPVHRDHGNFYLQLLRHGYTASDFLQIEKCVAAMDDLVGSHPREVRIFSEHAIGTASCSLSAGLSPITVCVALVHPTYFLFHEGRVDADAWDATKTEICDARRFVRNKVGAQVEEALWLFQLLFANGPSLKAIQNWILGMQRDIFTPLERELIGMSFCDESEDSTNGQQFWSVNNKNRSLEYQETMLLASKMYGNKFLESRLALGFDWVNVAFPNHSREMNIDMFPEDYAAVFQRMQRRTVDAIKLQPNNIHNVVTRTFYDEQEAASSEEFVSKWAKYRDLGLRYCDVYF